GISSLSQMTNGTQKVPTSVFQLKSFPKVIHPITNIGTLIINCVYAGLHSNASYKMVLTPEMPPAASFAGNKNILYDRPTNVAPMILSMYCFTVCFIPCCVILSSFLTYCTHTHLF